MGSAVGVVDDDGRLDTAVVAMRKAVEAFLSRRVPDLQGNHLSRGQSDFPQHERGADGGAVAAVEVVVGDSVGQGSLADMGFTEQDAFVAGVLSLWRSENFVVS